MSSSHLKFPDPSGPPRLRIARARRAIAQLRLQLAREDLAALGEVDGDGADVPALHRHARAAVAVLEQKLAIRDAEVELVEAEGR